MSKVKKHREFFMDKYTMECRFEKVYGDDIHVIEYAAFEHAATKCEEAQSELLSCRKEVEAMKAKLQIAVDALKRVEDVNEKLMVLEAKFISALEDIRSTKKSDLLDNPSYWGHMIVGRASEALETYQAEKKIEGEK